MKRYFLFLLIFVFCSDAHADITSNLLIWWKLDEGSGTTANDSSGNGNTGTLTASPTWVTGKIGSFALSFNGSTQYVDSSNIANANNQSNFTVSAWFKTSAAQANDCGGTFFSKLTSGGINSGEGWDLGICNGGCDCNVGAVNGQIQKDGSNYNAEDTNASYADGKWHQAVMVVSGGTTVTLYVDGTVPAETPQVSGTVSSFSNTSNVRIATDYDTEFYNGSVDDVRFYDRALTAGDVAQLYAYTGANYIRINNAKINHAKLGF